MGSVQRHAYDTTPIHHSATHLRTIDTCLIHTDQAYSTALKASHWIIADNVFRGTGLSLCATLFIIAHCHIVLREPWLSTLNSHSQSATNTLSSSSDSLTLLRPKVSSSRGRLFRLPHRSHAPQLYHSSLNSLTRPITAQRKPSRDSDDAACCSTSLVLVTLASGSVAEGSRRHHCKPRPGVQKEPHAIKSRQPIEQNSDRDLLKAERKWNTKRPDPI